MGYHPKSVSRDIARINDFLAEHRELMQNAEVTYSHKDRAYILKSDEFLKNQELFALVKVILGARCFSKEDQVEIPSEIEGKRVTKIGDYAFSAHKRKEDEAKEIMIGEDFLGSEDEPMFCGEAVKEVYLPPDTVEIGKYAFYGCVNLTTLGFSDSLLRTGAGIFTGCKLQKIYYDVYEDKKSALRDVVRDTRFPLQVNIRYKEEEKQSRLFYPEYYEEAVENTPARIVETHFHGTGYQYRQSFLRGEIDYRKYDDICPATAVAPARPAHADNSPTATSNTAASRRPAA
jgi:hypothetical protein